MARSEKLPFWILAVVALLPYGCKPRQSASDVKADAGGAVKSALRDFSFEPAGGFARKLGAGLAPSARPAAGCAHAARFAITGVPGPDENSRRFNRGEFVGSIKQVVQSGNLSWDNFEQRLALPVYAFMACKGIADYPSQDEIPREPMEALVRRAEDLKKRGLKLTLVVASTEEGEAAGGALSAVVKALENHKILGVRELHLKARADFAAEVARARQELNNGMSDTDALAIWAYGAAGPLVLHALGGAGEAQTLRNRVAVLVTVGAPLGGALPALATEKELDRALASLTQRAKLTAVDGADVEALKTQLQTAEWLRPKERTVALASLKSESFALSRNEAQLQGLSDKLQIAYVAAIQDPGSMRYFPRVQEGKSNAWDGIVAQLLLPLYQDFPLSDGMVALEHAVWPPDLVPAEVKGRLVAVLRLGHFDLAMAQPDEFQNGAASSTRAHALPVFALANAVFGAAFEAISSGDIITTVAPESPPPASGPPVVAAKAPQPNDGIPADGWLIKSQWNGMCLDIPDKTKPLVYAFTCHGGINQRWLVEPRGDTYVLKSLLTGKCLDAHTGDAEKRKGYVYMHDCHAAHNQVIYFGKGFNNATMPRAGMPWAEIHIGLYGTSRCFDIDTNGSKDGRRVYFHTECHGRENQQWRLDPG